MTDPLSVTAAVVGITAAAVQAAQALYITIDNIKDVPATIKGIKVDLQAIEAVLHSLCRELPNDSSQILLNDNIKRAAENINVACTTFRAKLERWMRHSTEDKAFWADRWRVGLFGQETIKTFKAQLNDYKGTLNVALNSATLYVYF